MNRVEVIRGHSGVKNFIIFSGSHQFLRKPAINEEKDKVNKNDA